MAKQPLVEVEVIGLDRLVRNLKDLPAPALATLLIDASSHAKRVAAEGVRGPVARSIQSQVTSTSARVFSLMSLARQRSIEEGRKAGGPLLHPDSLKRWISRVGYRESAMVLARLIRRRGVKGRFFMRAAIQSTQNVLPTMMKEMAQGVSKRFGRK